MSTHEDWEKARQRRNTAAVRVTRVVMIGRTATTADLADFAHADAEMVRLEAELEPKQEHTGGETE